ncbi:MAG: Methylated-DNA--protein-cysteine methyltransferase, constitutive [Firmicutes bacterium ADurb.Bin182]|nr:MAG: Methylated-DNA--protein-cysteine methyltransferase, constitutive [Firmicutes bacterium ADurb.Bin182]
MKYAYGYKTAIGDVVIVEEDGAITELFWETEKQPDGCVYRETELLREAGRQLALYCEGRLLKFDLPLSPKGTEFQKAVWQKLCEIPRGETRSYKQIAEAVGNPGACRAVGLANRNNPIPVIIPCHRVIGSDGKLVGFALGLENKRRLLELEGADAG